MHLDLYVRLEFIDNTPSFEDIKKAYRKLTKKCHPDLFPNDPEKEALFLSIQEAYEILSNEEKRKVYDNEGIFLSNNLERELRAQAIKNMESAYIAIIEQLSLDNITKYNIKELLLENIQENRVILSGKVQETTEHVKKLKIASERLSYEGSEDVLAKITKREIKDKTEETLKLSKAVKILDIMDDIVKSYSYKVDKQPENKMWSTNNTTISTMIIRMGV